MSKNIIVIGASGHGKVVKDIIKRSGDTFFGFLDDDTSKSGVIGVVDDCLKYTDMEFVIAIGNNQIRKRIAQKYCLRYYTAVHPNAIIADDVKIGEGTVVMANAVINADSKIGKHCIINTASVVEHDSDIADYVHISPGAVLCGTVKIGKDSHIGAGAVIKNNLSVTHDVLVGCGACVVKDILNPGVYVGNPAKEMESKK